MSRAALLCSQAGFTGEDFSSGCVWYCMFKILYIVYFNRFVGFWKNDRKEQK